MQKQLADIVKCVSNFFSGNMCVTRAIPEKVNSVIEPTQKCREKRTNVILRAKRQSNFDSIQLRAEEGAGQELTDTVLSYSYLRRKFGFQGL